MKKRGFLAEWHPQWGVLLAWPHPTTDWADNLAEAEACYAQIVAAISQRAHVLLLCRDASHQSHITAQLDGTDTVLSRIHWVQLPYNDTWARDFGFITVLEDGKPLLLDFTFNAWGGKFDAELDNAINRQLFQQPLLAGNATASLDLVLEGGSLETDGQGTLLTTTQCLLNPNRNPHLSQAQLEAALRDSLGMERILWLSHGYLEGDDTDAHIDTLARFADPQTIVYMSCNDPTDAHYQPLKAMEAELQALRQPNGASYHLVPVPIPSAIYEGDQRLPASYVNFLIVNGAVLLPVYADEAYDPVAIAQLRSAFPRHAIVPIDCRALIAQHGSLHCITMQIPKEVVQP